MDFKACNFATPPTSSKLAVTGQLPLDRITKPRKVENKTVNGINFLDPTDSALLHALQDPRMNIAGIRRADLLAPVEQLSPARLSLQLRRLR